MKKILAMALAGLSFMGLVGCGSTSGSSTVLMGSLSGETGTLTGVSMKAVNSSEEYSESIEVESSGDFTISKVPSGVATVTISSTASTSDLSFDLDIEDKATTEVEIYLMTWDPEPVAEYRIKLDGNDSFGSQRPLGPTGTTMSLGTDGSRTFETSKGLVVVRKSDGSVTVNTDSYTP